MAWLIVSRGFFGQPRACFAHVLATLSLSPHTALCFSHKPEVHRPVAQLLESGLDRTLP